LEFIDAMLEVLHTVNGHYRYPHTVALAEFTVSGDVHTFDVEREVLTHLF
jgi:hypothetical protein